MANDSIHQGRISKKCNIFGSKFATYRVRHIYLDFQNNAYKTKTTAASVLIFLQHLIETLRVISHVCRLSSFIKSVKK